jgi:hypothetical protein
VVATPWIGSSEPELSEPMLKKVLMSPFFVAHDIETAMSCQFEWTADNLFEVPAEFFVPVVVKVTKNHTSLVEFDILYRGSDQ